ncbi:MAG: hypothetical protein Q4F66_09300 [Clostridium sp.]|nr:hypothetical protein [Clostridium sp.]
MLSELERKIFNDRAIRYLAEGINNNLQKQNVVDEKKKIVIVKEINDCEQQINNIITAISNGFM